MSLLTKGKAGLFGIMMCYGIISATTISVLKTGGQYSTIQAGVTAARAGDTIFVKPGIYNESVSFGYSGNATSGYITLIGQSGAIVDGIGKNQPGITIANKNYIKVIGLEVQNFTGSNTPIGISVEGSSSNLEIRNNVVHNIESPNDNAHGIAFYGTSSSPINAILVDGNEIKDCRLGQSESMVLNGNVTNFIVSNNIVHNNDNIGIDFIGFEGIGPTGQDQARNGSCIGNRVYGVSSGSNPTYGGERSADGIYVDGGRDIVIERNIVDSCDIGIEVASEWPGKTTTNITVLNNFVSRSFQGNIMVGGYASGRGTADSIVIVNNTLYKGNDCEVLLQFNCKNITIKNNIFFALASRSYLYNGGSNNTLITVDNNLFYGASSSSPGSWADAHAKYVNPELENAPTNMHLKAKSPAIEAGALLPENLTGVLDIDEQTRLFGADIDIGADEFQSETDTANPASPRLNPVIFASKQTGSGNWTLTYTLIDASVLSYGLYVINGRRILFKPGSSQTPGTHNLTINCNRFSTGTYLLCINVNGVNKSMQIMLKR